MFTTPAQAQVVLSEVYPAPTSEEREWVELYNTSQETVAISGWKLFDHFSSKSELVTFANVQIEPHGFFIFELPTNKLNNSEEKITLENTEAIEVSSLHFANSESQKSFSFLFSDTTTIGTTLQLNIPTKNTINQLEPTQTPTPESTVLPQSPTPTVAPTTSLKALTMETTEPLNKAAPLTPSPEILLETISETPQTTNQKLELYRKISANLKLPKLVRIEKEGLVKRLPQLSYLVQKKVSKEGVISAIIGGALLLFTGLLL